MPLYFTCSPFLILCFPTHSEKQGKSGPEYMFTNQS